MGDAQQTIHEIVQGIVSSSPTRESTLSFVELAYRFSRAYLSNRLISESILGVNGNDMALDAIADLFRRDSDGRFVEVSHYYSEIDWLGMTESELWAATRRLVLGSVSDTVFRMYRDADPSLARIIRNIKRAVKGSNLLSIERQGGRLVVCSTVSKMAFPVSTPSWPEEIFEAQLMARTDTATHITIVLEGVGVILREVKMYQSSIPVTMLARIIRSSSARLNVETVYDEVPEAEFTLDELSHMVDNSLQKTRVQRHAFYVDRGKYSEFEYECIFDAVRARMLSVFTGGDGLPQSNFEALGKLLPSISRELYQTKYRHVLEYLYQCTRDHFVEFQKKSIRKSELLISGNE